MPRAALFLIVIVFLSCGPATAPQEAEWVTFRDSFIEAYFEHQPAFAVNAGRHEFDGRIADWSPAGLVRTANFLRTSRDRALAFDTVSLSERESFERDYLAAMADSYLFWFNTSQAPRKNLFFYALWFADNLSPDAYVTREYGPLTDRLRSYVVYARNVPRAAAQIRENLETPLPKTLVQIGRTSFGGLAGYLADDVPKIFAEVDDDALQKEFTEANSAAVAALRELDEWFAAHEIDANDDFALGPELFSEMLRRTEQVDVPLDRLREIGEQDMERNLAALEQACGKLVPGRTIAQCIEQARGMKPEGGPVEAARRQLGDLKRFVVENELASIPGPEEALVDEAPPHMRWNFAFINTPGPYEKELPSTYYISPPDPSWPEAQKQDYLPSESDLLFTSAHEVWPGHFLHLMHANRAESPFGQVFVSYAFTEGWAHYAEEMMHEAGLGNDDPAVHIGQLVNALLRNARYLSAIGLHTAGMTVEEAERLFIEKAYQDAGTARQQAARGTFDPAYVNYTLGKLMVRKLREDWTATRGGREAWREFHDTVLSYGGPPVPLLRRAMLGPEAGPPL